MSQVPQYDCSEKASNRSSPAEPLALPFDASFGEHVTDLRVESGSYPDAPWPAVGKALVHATTVCFDVSATPSARNVAASTDRRRLVDVRLRLEFWLDSALFVAYTLAYSFGFTGLAVHEWIGLVVGSALLVHLTLHWEWVIRTTVTWRRRSSRVRAIWVVNLLLMVCMTLCVTSGILISQVALPRLGVTPAGNDFWSNIHAFTARLTLVLAAAHIALSWRWIVSVGRRLLTHRWKAARQ